MKFNSSVFRGRFWLPGLVISAIGFLLISFYLGFQLDQNNEEDADNIQSISEINSAAVTAQFFVDDIVTGDSSSIDPLNLTLTVIQNNLDILDRASQYTKARVPNELAQVKRSWQTIQNDVKIAADAEIAINLVNSVSGYLEVGATEAEKIVLSAVARMSAANVPQYQIDAISRQAFLLQDMSNKINLFITSETANRDNIDKLQENIAEYALNNQLLTRGIDNRQPVTDPEGLLEQQQ